MSTTKYIHLIRHGQTESNKIAIKQEPDEHLNSLGKKQALLVADRIAKHFHAKQPIERIIASPLRRTSETAEYVHLACGRVPLLTMDSDFRECYEGEPFEWRHARARRAVKILRDAPEQHIVVVGHNIINNMMLDSMIYGKMLTRELVEATPLYFPNTGLITIQYRKPPPESLRSGWCIIAGDASHLFELEPE